MTKKKDPGKRPIAPQSPEEVLANAPLDVLMEALAKVSGQLQGKQGGELRKHVGEVKTQVDGVIQGMQLKLEDQEARKVVAGQVEKLVDAVVRTGTAVGDAVAAQRGAIVQAFRGVDLNMMADGLRLFAGWLQNPNDADAAKVKALVEQLQTSMGSMVGYDPARAEAEQAAEIKRDVQASMDEIFRGKKPS